MANVRTVGPLRMWTANGSHGRRVVVEHDGQREEHRADDSGARAVLAWRAYRERDERAADEYAGRAPGRCARCSAYTSETELRPNGETYPLCPLCPPLTPEERLLCAVAGVQTLTALDSALRRLQ